MNTIRNIAFWDNQLCERGTTVSLFDYAYYNQALLKNKSFIFYDKNRSENDPRIIAKFQAHFVVHATDDFKDIDTYIKEYNITHIYIIKYGHRDSRLSQVAKNCIHCVFDCSQPHGEVYSSISPWVHGNNGNYPVVPHMINLPNTSATLRGELNIPANAVVFAGYGGRTSFSIEFVYKVIYDIAYQHPDIYFLFANFPPFCPALKNIIHLPTLTDLEQKARFINTADAMLWARRDGETFGIAIGEFSSKNKPVIAMKIGDLAHAHLLGEKAFWYYDKNSLQSILLNFNPAMEGEKDWNAYTDYTPEKVMQQFKAIYLD